MLFKDIRTYGFRETYYEEAREPGVLFVRFPERSRPVVVEDGGELR